MWHVSSKYLKIVFLHTLKGGDDMRRLTMLLFQLFLAIFAGYAVLYDVPNQFLLVPLLCLVCMFFLGRHPDASEEKDSKELVVDM
jgi:hypothetical protein